MLLDISYLQSKDELQNKIYLDDIPLYDRIDFAWDIYSTDLKKHPNKKITDKVKLNALYFLIYAFDLDVEDPDINFQLKLLMDERNKYKAENPEYIPTKTPKHILPIPPTKRNVQRNSTPNYTQDPAIQKAITEKELLNNAGRHLDKKEGTRYLTAEERANWRLMISHGIFKHNNKPYDTSSSESHNKKGFIAFTLNANGELSVFERRAFSDEIAHSTPNAGAPVVAAGELKIENGVLLAITTYSGHYQPSLFNIYRVLEYFTDNNVDISHTMIITENKPKTLSNNTTKTEDGLYQTPATDIYHQIKSNLKSQVKSIVRDIKAYEESYTTKMSKFRDKLIRSNLTVERTTLAANFRQELMKFKKSLNDYTTPEQLQLHTEQLTTLISKYEELNLELSKKYHKENINPLAQHFSTFKPKKRRDALSDNSSELTKEKIEPLMKKIF